MNRPSSDKQRDALKTAFALAVDALGGGAIVEKMTRVNASMLSVYAARHMPERNAGLDIALDIDLAHIKTGAEPPVARTYLALLGFDIVPAAPSTNGGELSLGDLDRLIREACDVQSTLLLALADRSISPNEKTRLKRELAELRGVLSAIEAKVDAA